jgi:hypothetical protein
MMEYKDPTARLLEQFAGRLRRGAVVCGGVSGKGIGHW